MLIIRINGSYDILEILQSQGKDKSTSSKKEEKADAEEKDDRDIDQLLEFIQRDDRRVQDKKKKRKKKQRNKEGAGLEAEAKVEEAKALVQEVYTSEAKHQMNEARDICQEGLKSETIGGCKKKVKSKQIKAYEEIDKCIAEKEAMLEERSS